MPGDCGWLGSLSTFFQQIIYQAAVTQLFRHFNGRDRLLKSVDFFGKLLCHFFFRKFRPRTSRTYLLYIHYIHCMHMHMYIYIHILYIYTYMVAPPPRAYLGRGVMYHLPSVVLNTVKDMLRKHGKFQCFMHILLVLFW